ncbi:MAG: hypothetical protein LBM93_00845 [Oscillospiraceae bacterium]|jgi:hypothetical protein|nr:hypothetical protein [Oscillospiraceae bacterium]
MDGIQNQVQEPITKTKNPFKITTAILAVLILGLSGVIVWQFLNKENKTTDNSQNTASNNETTNQETPEESNNSTEDKNDKAVRDVVLEIEKSAKEYAPTVIFSRTWNETFPIYHPKNMKSAVRLDKSYGLSAFQNVMTLESIISSEGFISAIKNKLIELGFTTYDDISIDDAMGSTVYINKKTGVICNGIYQSTSLDVECSHTSWSNSDVVKISNKMAEAYKKKEGEYPIVMYANPENIVNSSYKPYQRIAAHGLEAVEWFYRTNTNSEWVYFTGAQSILSCDEYNTDDLRKAFAGEKCQTSSDKVIEVQP